LIYREKPKPHCPYHNRIQAASWGRGIRGLWYLRCIMCGAEAPAWKWMLVPYLPILDDLPTGPGPYHTIDPRFSDAALRRLGVSEERIQNRVREIEPPLLKKLVAKIERLEP
jgi:hypothetical protein